MNRTLRLVLFCVAGLVAGRAQPVDLLLVGADEPVLKPIVARLEGVTHEEHAAWEFWSGQLAGKSVILTRTGGDPMNAVAATTLAIRRHKPRLVVVYGVARPHDPALKTGDLIVSQDFAPFDGMWSPVTKPEGGSSSLRWEVLPHLAMAPGEKETPVTSVPADAAALALATKLSLPSGRVVSGTLGSANQVNREADRIAWIHKTWHTSTEDGESAHVAFTAQLLGIPAIGFRVVDGNPAEVAAFTLRFVEAWK